MAAWADDIFANLPRMRGKPGPPLPGSPARPELPPSRGLRQDMLPVDPRAGVSLFPTAGFPAQQQPPGTSMNSAPDWLSQMQDARFAGY